MFSYSDVIDVKAENNTLIVGTVERTYTLSSNKVIKPNYS